ncbi:hypothetical protein [Enterobacter cloacae complex sp. 288G10]
MKFVAGDSAAAGNEGHPISTLSDTFRQMRKVSNTLLTATQNGRK